MKVQNDNHLISAGECFMFLCWVESSMRDFIVLHDGGEDMRARYNKAIGSEVLPSDFSRCRLKMGAVGFGKIKNRFLTIWPAWKTRQDVHEAIERAVIWRNAFGHAQIQPFRPYLLYTPNEQSWRNIGRFTRCGTCLQYQKYCQCSIDDNADPPTVIMRCLDQKFLQNIYRDIQTIDTRCFLSTAKELNIFYQGIAWPKGSRFLICRYSPDKAAEHRGGGLDT